MKPFASLSKLALAIASPRVTKLELLLKVPAIVTRARISRVTILRFPGSIDSARRRVGLPTLGLAGIVGVRRIAVVLVLNALNS